MSRVLFGCSRNRWRSPTAEQVFSEYPRVESASAGLSPAAENPVTPELLEWANMIFVMEKAHKVMLAALFAANLASKRVICPGIRDNYKFIEPAQVKLLKSKVDRFLLRG